VWKTQFFSRTFLSYIPCKHFMYVCIHACVSVYIYIYIYIYIYTHTRIQYTLILSTVCNRTLRNKYLGFHQRTLYNSIYIFFSQTAHHRVSFVFRIFHCIIWYLNKYLSFMEEKVQERKDDMYECFTFPVCYNFMTFSFFFEFRLEETGSDTTICYFIISVLFSIGNHNIHCTKQKFIFGTSRTSCILRMRCAWNLKVRFFHHLVSLSIHLFHFIILWCFLFHPSIRDLLTSYVNLECVYVCGMSVYCILRVYVCAMYTYTNICIWVRLCTSHRKIIVANNIPFLPRLIPLRTSSCF